MNREDEPTEADLARMWSEDEPTEADLARMWSEGEEVDVVNLAAEPDATGLVIKHNRFTGRTRGIRVG